MSSPQIFRRRERRAVVVAVLGFLLASAGLAPRFARAEDDRVFVADMNEAQLLGERARLQKKIKAVEKEIAHVKDMWKRSPTSALKVRLTREAKMRELEQQRDTAQANLSDIDEELRTRKEERDLDRKIDAEREAKRKAQEAALAQANGATGAGAAIPEDFDPETKAKLAILERERQRRQEEAELEAQHQQEQRTIKRFAIIGIGALGLIIVAFMMVRNARGATSRRFDRYR